MWQMTHKYRHMTRLQCDTNHILEFQSPFIEFDNSNIFNRIVAAWLEYVFGCVANNISQFKNYQKIICRKINSKCIPSSTDIIPRQPLLSSTHVKKVIFDRNWWFYILKCILRLGWIPRNIKIFIFKQKLSFLNENRYFPENDNFDNGYFLDNLKNHM